MYALIHPIQAHSPSTPYSFWLILVSFSAIFIKNCPLFHKKTPSPSYCKRTEATTPHPWSSVLPPLPTNLPTACPERSEGFKRANLPTLQLFEFTSFFHSTPSPCHRESSEAISAPPRPLSPPPFNFQPSTLNPPSPMSLQPK